MTLVTDDVICEHMFIIQATVLRPTKKSTEHKDRKVLVNFLTNGLFDSWPFLLVSKKHDKEFELFLRSR